MSKLEELIAELCPDGVEYVKLKEVAHISAGGDLPKKYAKGQNVPTEQYPYPIYSNGTEGGALYGFTDSYKIEKEAVTISARGTIGYHEVRAGKFTPIVRLITMIADESKITTKFLHYAMYVAGIEGVTTGIPSLTVPMLEKFTIPLPPLPVQSEIVRILNNFTELSAELKAELKARKKQYQYYRVKLLTQSEDTPKVTLKTVVKKSYSGGTPTKGNSEYYENGTIPWLRTQDVKFNEIYEINSFITEEAVKKTSAKWIPANCVIVAISGATAGRCAINKIATTTNQHCLNMEIDSSKALYKYIYYCVCSQYEELISRKQGARGDLNSTLIMGIEIPLTTLKEQQRIVDILDRFDVLCNDISAGLPAEIEARTKQYEYYRDKLLTFKELS